MDNIDMLWKRIKELSDEEWQGLRARRDLIKKKTTHRPNWQELVGIFSSDDLAQMKAAIDAECERIDPDGWD